jgi:hypothetical protein
MNSQRYGDFKSYGMLYNNGSVSQCRQFHLVQNNASVSESPAAQYPGNGGLLGMGCFMQSNAN